MALSVPNVLLGPYPWIPFVFLSVTLASAKTPFAKTPSSSFLSFVVLAHACFSGQSLHMQYFGVRQCRLQRKSHDTSTEPEGDRPATPEVQRNQALFDGAKERSTQCAEDPEQGKTLQNQGCSRQEHHPGWDDNKRAPRNNHVCNMFMIFLWLNAECFCNNYKIKPF